MSSAAAWQPVPYMATYAATKAFELHLTEAIAAELRGTGVRALAVCPGPTRPSSACTPGRRRARAIPFDDPDLVRPRHLAGAGRRPPAGRHRAPVSRGSMLGSRLLPARPDVRGAALTHRMPALKGSEART